MSSDAARLPQPNDRLIFNRVFRTARWNPGRQGPASLLAFGLLGVALAVAGQAVVAKQKAGHLGFVLFALGVAVFAFTARGVPPAPSDLPATEPWSGPDRGWRRWLAIAGMTAALLVGAVATKLIYGDVRSTAGLRLWLTSLGILFLTGFIAGRKGGWPARWGLKSLPERTSRRWLLGATVFAILIAASVARLASLATIPRGLNPDEGDQAVNSIQIIRGVNKQSVFEDGWYQISVMFYWLLAQFMKLVGIGYVQAKEFSAVTSVVAVAAVTWLGLRNFGLRVGLLAGGLAALMGISIQTGRFVTMATPTAMLWAVSVALLLEGARRGKDWAWIGAGLAGGFSIYFYPTGRLWPAIAGAFCVHAFLRASAGLRREIARGAAMTALAALLMMAPFYAVALQRPNMLWLRANETSIFTQNNVLRLPYYRKDWSMARLLLAQTDQALGLFNRWGDYDGFWPTHRAILSFPLSVLMLVGLAWSCLRWSDSRFVALALWFWIGFVGVIITIDTPSLHRMVPAVPVLALFAALVLDNMARRVEILRAERGTRERRLLLWTANGAVALIAAWAMWLEGRFYFVDFAKMDEYSFPRIETEAVRSQGAGSLVLSIGRAFHFSSSGTLHLMAPEISLAGIRSPGSDLPLALPANRDVTFLIYYHQPGYLPYLRELYPEGAARNWTNPSDSNRLVVTTFKLSQKQWSEEQGALLWPRGQSPIRVKTIPSVPPGWNGQPGPMRWTAHFRVEKYWNYAFRLGPGPARLTIDGQPVLSVPAGSGPRTASMALARGLHAIECEAVWNSDARKPQLDWAPLPLSSAPPSWSPLHTEDLSPTAAGPQGLFGTVRIAGRPEQRRVDGALASCCLSSEIQSMEQPFTATWTGTLKAPASGKYSMSLFAQGAATLTIDGDTVIHTEASSEFPTSGEAVMTAGPHAVEVALRVTGGPGGLEWTWTPPGGVQSIVPPSVLSPPSGKILTPVVGPDRLEGDPPRHLPPELYTVQ